MRDWTIETDEEDAARQQSGAINGRYQICHPVEGLIETADTLADAFDIADRWDNPERSGYPAFAVEVYDRMARHGQPRTWRRQPKDATHCFEHGDRLTMTGRYKVVVRRGVEPRQTADLSQCVW